MKNKLIAILDELYGLSKNEKENFEAMISELDENSLNALWSSLYKRLVSKKENLKNLSRSLNITLNSINESKEKILTNKTISLDY